MQLKMVLAPDGTLLVSVLDGAFPEARAALAALLAQLGADGFALVPETAIEQHRHEPASAQVHEHHHDRA